MSNESESFATRYGPWAVIAGASDGTGSAFATAVATRGINVVLLARRPALLDEVASQIQERTGVDTRRVVVDLSTPTAFDTIVDATRDIEVGTLMYNAGGDPTVEPFLTRGVERATDMITRNCTLPTQLCYHFGSTMLERGRGGIVLVSSAAGLLGRPTMAIYGATKAFDIVLAEALWSELHGTGVDVLAPILGATDTPALRQVLVKQGALAVGDDRSPIPTAVTAEWVAEGIVENLPNGPTWYGGDWIAERCESLRVLPRNDAVRAAATR